MFHLSNSRRLLGVLCAAVLAQGCSSDSSESLKPADPKEAKEYAERLATAGCEKLYSCLDEAAKAKKDDKDYEDDPSSDEDSQDILVEKCVEKATSDLLKDQELESCEAWDPQLAKSCLKETKSVECSEIKSLDDIEVPNCKDFFETCNPPEEEEDEDDDDGSDEDDKDKDKGKGKDKDDKDDDDKEDDE